MLTGLFLFVAGLALASAQCALEGAVYEDVAGNVTVFFGAAVDGWIPAVQYKDDQGQRQAWFVTWQQATNTRWELRDWGATGFSGACANDIIGQYRFFFSDDCASLTVQEIHDDCEERAAYWGNDTVFSFVPPVVGQCRIDSGFFGQSSDSPALSGEGVIITGAFGDLYVASVSTYAAVFFEWVWDENEQVYVARDFTSVPYGYACESNLVGRYNLITSDTSCDKRICGVSDSCAARAQLYQNLALNGDSIEPCTSDIEFVEWPNSGCSRGNTWTLDPYDCIGQFGGGACIFCRGVANGLDVKTCIDRTGGTCEDIFNSIPAQGWCNLEFECPASTLSLSVIAVFVSVLLALFF